MRFVLKLVVAIVIFQFAAAAFERVAPRSLIKQYWKIANPLWMLVAGRIPGFVLLETTGRRTGRKHRVPVGARMEDGSLWLVAAHASQADYVKNIEADPEIRVLIGGVWRAGTARLMPEDDARHRATSVNLLNGWFERIASPDLLTVRIEI